jgi:hypothetical protein
MLPFFEPMLLLKISALGVGDGALLEKNRRDRPVQSRMFGLIFARSGQHRRQSPVENRRNLLIFPSILEISKRKSFRFVSAGADFRPYHVAIFCDGNQPGHLKPVVAQLHTVVVLTGNLS